MNAFFNRRSSVVSAWQMPALGQPADRPPPFWVVDRIADGTLFVNPLGGLSTLASWGHLGCAPGDWITFDGHDRLDFVTNERFLVDYDIIDAQALLKAA